MALEGRVKDKFLLEEFKSNQSQLWMVSLLHNFVYLYQGR